MPTPPPDDIDRYLALALACADAAGKAIARHFRQPVAVDTKADATPVTIADRDAEIAMRLLIEDAFPDHGIIGEEMGRTNPDAALTWVLDPIDGTKSFITGKPTFGTLVALASDGVPIIGIIDQPISKERWIGVTGRDSLFSGAPCRVRPCPALADAVLYTTSPHLFSDEEGVAFHRLRKQVRHALYGGDCYSYGLMAAGFADIVVEAGLKPFDYAALVPVIEGAGGVITGWDGKPLTLSSDGCVVAAGDARVHEAALKALRPD